MADRLDHPPLVLAPGTGGYDGKWFHEDHRGASRISLRAAEHLHGERSEYQKLDVYRSAFFGRFLTLDDLVMFTERDEFVYHEMLVHVPLCSMESPRRVLIIGGGDAGCLREALRHPSVEEVVQCDIDERVTRVCQEHFGWVGDAIADPRATVLFDDGVEYIRQHQGEFDLVIVDSTDPIGPAVGLFQADFYRAVSAALRPGGVMVAQTESPHWGAGLVGGIYAEIRQAFSRVYAYMGSIPTYPSGSWCWAYASQGRDPQAGLDAGRAAALEPGCKYWNREVHRGAFLLPTFARRAVEGEDLFARFDAAHGVPQPPGD